MESIHDEQGANVPASVGNLSEVVDQLKSAIWFAFLGWVVAPEICRAIRFGEVVLVIHDGQLKDVRVDLSTRSAGPPPKH